MILKGGTPMLSPCLDCEYLPSSFPSSCYSLSFFLSSFRSSFHSSFLPSVLPSFHSSFSSSFLPLFLPSALPSVLPSFRSSFLQFFLQFFLPFFLPFSHFSCLRPIYWRRKFLNGIPCVAATVAVLIVLSLSDASFQTVFLASQRHFPHFELLSVSDASF